MNEVHTERDRATPDEETGGGGLGERCGPVAVGRFECCSSGVYRVIQI